MTCDLCRVVLHEKSFSTTTRNTQRGPSSHIPFLIYIYTTDEVVEEALLATRDQHGGLSCLESLNLLSAGPLSSQQWDNLAVLLESGGGQRLTFLSLAFRNGDGGPSDDPPSDQDHAPVRK